MDHEEEHIPDAVLHAVIADAHDPIQAALRIWDATGSLPDDAWDTLRDQYTENGEPAERPAEPLVLWRGAPPEFRANPSWTSNPDAAWLYASEFWRSEEVGLIWRAAVEPERLIAHLQPAHRRYDEYIVDTAGLTIEPHQLWCRCPVDLAPFRRDARLALDLHEVVHCTRG